MAEVLTDQTNGVRFRDMMTPEERLRASIALQPVDRVSCALFVQGYAAKFAGITQAKFYNDFDLAQRCMDQLKAAFPIWDVLRSSYVDLGYSPSLRNRWFQKVALPGEELPEDLPYQILEESLATQEEMKAIKKTGLTRYMMTVTKRIRPSKGLIHFLLWEMRRNRMAKREVAATLKRGQAHYYGGTYSPPYELLSMTRGMNDFSTDLYRLKDELADIMWSFQKDCIKMAVKSCKNSGVMRAFIVGCRCGGTFLNKRQFETFSWPFLKDGALKLIEAGITPIFHLDTDWGRVLEYFLELPKGRCIIETDGETDLFRAKEILKDHTCLSGDIPPGLLTVGGATEVDEYCKKLIQVVGKGGGFILSNGCTLPPNAKHENVKAIFDAVEKYGRHGEVAVYLRRLVKR
jgi:uroporphyrinogen decarboxylase